MMTPAASCTRPTPISLMSLVTPSFSLVFFCNPIFLDKSLNSLIFLSFSTIPLQDGVWGRRRKGCLCCCPATPESSALRLRGLVDAEGLCGVRPSETPLWNTSSHPLISWWPPSFKQLHDSHSLKSYQCTHSEALENFQKVHSGSLTAWPCDWPGLFGGPCDVVLPSRSKLGTYLTCREVGLLSHLLPPSLPTIP